MRKLDLARSGRYKWWVFLAIAIGTFSSVVEHGSVTVALPSIADHFHTDLPTTQWIVIGYALTISALLLPMGRLSDIVGRKRVYVTGLVVFVIGGVLAGSAGSVLVLILSKVLQGVGAAMTQGTSMAMIVETFSSEERGRALGLQMSVVGTGGVAGPAVGGFLVSGLGWEWVFYFNVLLASLAIVAALIVLDGRRASQDGGGPGFDWPGAAMSTAALVIFLLAMSNGHSAGWGSPLIVLSMLGFLALLGAFVWWELRAPAPMLDVRLFQRKLFSLGVTASFISFLGMSSVRFLMPFYLQSILGYNAGQVGLIIVPSAIAMIVTGPLSGRLSDRYGWRIFNVGGLALGASGLFLMTALDETSPLGLAMAGMILSSCGVGVFNAPNNSSILGAVEPSRYGVVAGFLNLIRNSANVTSIALTTAIVTATMASMGYLPTLAAVSDGGDAGVFEAFTSGMRVAFLTMGSLILVGIVISFMRGGRVPETLSRSLDGAEVSGGPSG